MGYAKSFLVSFKYSDKVSYVVEFSHKKIRLFAKNQIVTEGGIELFGYNESLENGENLEIAKLPCIEIATPYGYEDLWDEEEKCFNIQTIQHSDILYIFNENHPIYMLKRYSNTDWRLEELEIKNGPYEALNTDDVMIMVSDVEGDIDVVADGDIFSDTDVGRLIRLRNYDDDTKYWVASKEYKAGDICLSDNKYYEALNSDVSGSNKPVHSVGAKSDGGVRWKYIHDGMGVVKITEYVDKRNVKAKVINRVPERVKLGTLYWEFGLLHNGIKHPKSGAFFRNRFCFLINTKTGPFVCMSCSGDYNNFADLEIGEATAETAISVPVINTEFNEGKWIYAKDVLFVGTGASEFYIDVMTTSSAMASDNVRISQISNVGSKAILPVSVGSHVFFVDRYGLSLRDLMYDYYSEGYNPIDVSILGKHLFQARIVGISYQEVPDKILWCLTGDGGVVGMTFSQEHEVAAFSRHDFSGDVESLAVIGNLADCRDELWIVVKRIIGGKVIRSVEKVEHGVPCFWPDSVYAVDSIKERDEREAEYVKNEALYLDGMVVFEREIGDETVEISGLSHLEGMKVKVFADGGLVRDDVVIGGKVNIDKNMARVVVGLAIKSQFIPQYVFVDNELGSGIGQRQRINHVLLMLYMSGGGRIGRSEDCLHEIYYRKSDDEMNEATKLFTGIREILFDGASNLEQTGATIMIENDSPLPMNILAIIPYMDVA